MDMFRLACSSLSRQSLCTVDVLLSVVHLQMVKLIAIFYDVLAIETDSSMLPDQWNDQKVSVIDYHHDDQIVDDLRWVETYFGTVDWIFHVRLACGHVTVTERASRRNETAT